MALAPFPKRADAPDAEAAAAEDGSSDWMMMAASGALVAGGLLLLARQRKAGLVTAASGTALALLDQQDALRRWWGSLPGYMERVQSLIGKVQSTVDDLAAKREQITQAMATGPKEV
ncbi:MAG TPA: hypothetical protein VFU55_08935 [Terracidiphilus sp.]|nr:hypothetical protein [Terracidiphilus sp.]